MYFSMIDLLTVVCQQVFILTNLHRRTEFIFNMWYGDLQFNISYSSIISWSQHWYWYLVQMENIGRRYMASAVKPKH